MIFKPLQIKSTFPQYQIYNEAFMKGMRYCFEELEKYLTFNIQSYYAKGEEFPAILEERLKEAKKELF